MKSRIIILFVLTQLSIYGCSKDNNNNEIEWIKIGPLTWSNKNIDVDTLGIGIGYSVEYVKDFSTWKLRVAQNQPAYCYYKFDEKYKNYGKLYNAAAAAFLAPPGMHIPTKGEYQNLIDYLGGNKAASIKLKSSNYWINEKLNTDEYNFSALPSGMISNLGYFGYIGVRGYFWVDISNKNTPDNAKSLSAIYFYDDVNFGTYGIPEISGMSVRFVKDY